MNIFQVFQDPNTQWILFGSVLLGISSGVIGCFAYLRKQSLMGDALSHAALPGVCLAFILTGTKSIFFFLIGAMIAGILATMSISFITRYSRIKQDSALGIILTVFFGIGIVLLTQIQHSASGNQSGLDKFLFGQAASMVHSDVYTMAGISLFLIGVSIVFFKEFKLLSFDPGFAKGIGLPTMILDQFIMLLLVIAVVIGIQAVGVVLMAALLITPAVSARYWTEKLHVMIILAGLFGGTSGLIGTIISTWANNLPTGPLIVLSATSIFVVSIVLAPSRGVLAKAMRQKRAKTEILNQQQLKQAIKDGNA
ncbi:MULTISPECIES: metal ABC transporter permease [Heyndrickxia]|jgi:manganese/zinc/iron transport system permease protein|uniref:metal ABC transporter permease n=1 Tax=Heyndrickxia TaxID=2837504 RepID=UPI000716F119|nr:metal ABC transporter permease [Heyndrickxia oleronia]MCI1592970.1 metal ABC transporter permease [Heyndrickxia oleronia]MCI1615121.1 metal ABC transporter permease [Heyndrickxia oleronia]MCI1763403.1 metal ABC transporter permease [Heyndrickxia oleronia]OJH20550.1 manganese ABC transporter [Bacillus obstructivus]